MLMVLYQLELQLQLCKFKLPQLHLPMVQKRRKSQQLAETAKVDVIILDIHFPAGGHMEWSGFTVMQWLKRLPGLGDIPVIMMTGSESAQYREQALAAGAVAFFQKPVKYHDLRAAIMQALGSRSSKAPRL